MIISEVNKEGSVTATRNGQATESPNFSNNFLVHVDDIIQFSKECWNKIVDWINGALNLNINKIEEIFQSEQTQDAGNTIQSQAEKEKLCEETYKMLLDTIPPTFGDVERQFLEDAYQKILKNLPETVTRDDISVMIFEDFLHSQRPNLSPEIRHQEAIKLTAGLFPGSTVKTLSPQELYSEVTQILLSEDFRNIVQESIPEEYRDTVLEILNPNNNHIIIRDEDNGGSARADKKCRQIIINNRTFVVSGKTDFIKILIHEAMHIAQTTDFDTKEEELNCEATAIKVAAALVEKQKLDDNAIYGFNFTMLGEMSDDELRQFLQENFLESFKDIGIHNIGPYSNYIIDNTGAVNIQDINGNKVEIAGGTKITVDGIPLVIGENAFIEGTGAFAGTTCTLFTIVEHAPVTIGILSFDDLEPLNGGNYGEVNQRIYLDHRASIDNNNFIPCSLVDANGRTRSFKLTNLNRSVLDYLSSSLQ